MVLLPAFGALFLCAFVGALRAYQIGSPMRRISSDDAFAELIERHRSRLTFLILTLTAVPALTLPLFQNLVPFTPQKQVAFSLFFFLDILVISLAVAIGDFPTRKVVFNDGRDLYSFVVFTIRLLWAFLGFWLVLLFAPMILHQAGTGILAWTAAATLSFLLLFWSRNSHVVFCRLLEARPLEDVELLVRFRAILAKSTAVRPEIYECGPWNGGWCNAVALPSTRTPRVVLSHTLLRLLEKEEAAAIFSHEVAHLEDFNPAVVRVMRRWESLLILTSCFLEPILLTINPALGPWGYWTWLPVAIGLLIWRIRDMQHRETASDLRAVDLSGNPEALISALNKLHEISRLPRRMPAEVERNSSHPSLARRIRDIRDYVRSKDPGTAAGDHAAGAALRESARAESSSVAAAGESECPWILAVVSRNNPCELMVMDENRVTWLSFPADCVPPPPENSRLSPHEVESLRKEACLERSATYGALSELRLVITGDGALIHVVERSGGPKHGLTRFPVKDAALRPIREALDRVDTRLAPLTGADLNTCALLRLVCFSTALLALLASIQGIVTGGAVLWLLIVSIPALSLAHRPWVAALGAMAVWAALSRVLLTFDKTWWTPAAWGALALVSLAGVYCLCRSIAKTSKPGVFRLPDGAPGKTALILFGLASLFALLQLFGLDDGEGLSRLYAFGLNSTGSFLPLVGAAAALLTSKWISIRLVACLLGLIGVSHVWIGSQHFLETYSGDPLVPHVSPFDSRPVAYREVNQFQLEGTHRGLEISPRGKRFFTEPESSRVESSIMKRYLLSDWSGTSNEIAALKLHFLDDERLLVLMPTIEGKVEIQTRHADRPNEVLWRHALPGLDPTNDLGLSGESNKWRVTANPGEGITLRLGGLIDTDIFEVHTWSHHTRNEHWRFIGAGERALQVTWGGARRGRPGSAERLAWILQRYWHRNELQWLSEAGAEPPGQSVLSVDACEPAFGQPNLMIFLYGPARGWVCAANTVNGMISPIAAVDRKFESDWNGERLALLHRDHLLLADPATRDAMSFPLPREADWNSQLALGDTAVALSWQEGGTTRVTLLEIPTEQLAAQR